MYQPITLIGSQTKVNKQRVIVESNKKYSIKYISITTKKYMSRGKKLYNIDQTYPLKQCVSNYDIPISSRHHDTFEEGVHVCGLYCKRWETQSV